MDAMKSQAFADALARARQLAAKLGAPPGTPPTPPSQAVVGVKRGFDDYSPSEPDAKRSASAAALADPFGAQLVAMKGAGGGPATAIGLGIKTGLGISGSGKACSEEIRIPDPLVGLIIGRGGEQINRIQSETGCKVQLAPDNGSGQARPCHLQGTKDAIERAKEMVMEIISSKSSEVGKTGGFSGSKGPSLGASPGQGQVELMIPGAKVGLIIGKGGETIRNLQDKSGTKMFILQENMFEECDKPLRIIGEPDLVEHARQLVLDIINEGPKNEYGAPSGNPGGGLGRGKSEYGGFGGGGMETMKFPVPKVSVGLIIGKGGDMIKRIQVETGAKVQFDPINSDMGDMDEQLAIITGKPDQIRAAQLKIEELVETALYGNRSGPGGAPGGGGGGRESGGGGGYPGSGGGFGGGRGQRRDEDEERMVVPVARVGMIIGKGGETIRSINQTSGAHCEIDRNLPQDGPDRTFVIRGSRQQVQHAKELIQEKVNTLPPKGRGEYGSQGWNYGSGDYESQDTSKMADAATAAQWAAYYAQYYQQSGSSGGVPGSAGDGQTDYTQQWIEYFRAQGNHQQADLLEQQGKSGKPEIPSAPVQPAPGSVPPASAGAANGTPNAGQSVDYSQQWAEHYRSIGKIQEAEAIEAYIKSQKQQIPAPSASAPAPPGEGGPAPPPYQNYGNFYPSYGNGQPSNQGGMHKSNLTPPGDS